MSPAVRPTGVTTAFLQEWRATGVAAVRLPGGPGGLLGSLEKIEREAEADPALETLLRHWHGEALEDLPGEPLPFDESAARLGATLLFRAAWFYLQREEDAARIATLLHAGPAAPRTPAAMFSADLALRCLPDIFRIVSTLTPTDPLVPALQWLAAEFPLSGAAVPPAEGAPFAPPPPAVWAALHAHPGVRRMFVDRILAAKARWWLAFPEIRQAARDAGGAYRAELLPDFDPGDEAPFADLTPHERPHD